VLVPGGRERPTRRIARLVAALAVVAAPLAVPGVVAAQSDDPPPPPVSINDFIPEDRDLSDCISALPRPGCGSEARSGWRQGLVFAVVVAGLGVIGWRIVAGIRQRDRVMNAPATGEAHDEPVT
jgi:hypothetical protein